jgi:hypothetical protein
VAFKLIHGDAIALFDTTCQPLQTRFATDSPLEGARFEPSVPAKEDAFEIDRPTSLASHSARGTEGRSLRTRPAHAGGSCRSIWHRPRSGMVPPPPVGGSSHRQRHPKPSVERRAEFVRAIPGNQI